MPLGTREILVAIRARDVTSRVLGEIGTNFGKLGRTADDLASRTFRAGAALTGLGVGVGAIGVAGLNFFNHSVDAFIEYNRAASLTLTQVDQMGVKVQDLEKIGARVASKIPVPFDQMQSALYDIFSSMDIGVKDAEGLLALFAKGAVAGQTDIRTAARATISVMNAYQIPFTGANKVMDIMFEMVRKGVGTYEEFNTAIGRAIPAAVSASQEFGTLAGVMAFLTRAGLSTQMAATSAARAMELFTKPDVTEALRKIGVETVDARGNFRQLDDVLMDLAQSKGWAQLGSAERKKLFVEIFGQGTIQARRFFDTAIPNFESLLKLTDVTSNSAGELDKAYTTMFDTPAMKAQLLRNQIDVLTVSIGEQLVPAKLRLMKAAAGVLRWWSNLDKGTRNLIVTFAAWASVVATVSGILLTLTGVVLMVTSLLAGLVGGFAAALGIISGVGLALGALAAIAMVVIANWDKLKNHLEVVFGAIAAGIGLVVTAFGGLIATMETGFLATMLATASTIGLVVAALFALVAVIILVVKNWDTIKRAVTTAVKAIVDAVQAVWKWFNNLHAAGQVLVGSLLLLLGPFGAVAAIALVVYKNWSTLVRWGHNLVDAAKSIFDAFMNLSMPFKIAAGVILAVVAPVVALIGVVVALGVAIYKNWDTIRSATVTAWGYVVDAVTAAWDWLKSFWNWLTNIDIDVWGDIKDAAVTAFHAVIAVVQALANAFKVAFGAIVDVVGIAADGIVAAWGPVQRAFAKAFDWFMKNFGKDFVDIWNKLSDEVGDVVQELGETASALADYWDFAFGKVRTASGYVWKAFQFMWDRIKPVLEVFMKVTIAIFANLVRLLTTYVITPLRIFANAFVNSFDTIVDILDVLWSAFKFAMKNILNVVTLTLKNVVDVIKAGVDIMLAIWDHFGRFLLRPFKIAWDFVVSIVKSAIQFISNAIQLGLNIIQGDWGEAWNNIKDMFGAVWDAIFATGRAALRILKEIYIEIPKALIGLLKDLIPIVFRLAKDVFGNLLDAAKTGVTDLLSFLGELGPKLLDLLKDAGSWLFDIGKDIVRGLVNGVKAVWDSIARFAKDVFNAIVGGIKDFFGIGSPSTVMLALGKDIVMGLFNGMKAVWALLWNWFTTLAGLIIGYFKNGVNWLFNAGKAVLTGLFNGIKTVYNVIIAPWFTTVPTLIKNFFVSAGQWLYQSGRNVLNGLKNGVKWLWDNVIVGFFNGLPQSFKNFFKLAVTWLFQAGKDVIQGLKNGIKTMVDNMGSWIKDRVGDIVGKFKSFFGIHSPSSVMAEVGKNFMLGFMKGVIVTGKNIPSLVKKIGMSALDMMKYLGIEVADIVSSLIPSLGKDIGGFQALGKKMAAAFGWTGGQWEALRQLWSGESGWNPSARNPSSGAYGIPQALPPGKMGGKAQASNADLMSRAAAQIAWGLQYIKGRYGNPISALQQWMARTPHWYAKGSWNVPYTGLAGLHKGEMVIPAAFARQIRRSTQAAAQPVHRGAQFIFHGPVTFGSEKTPEDLDWFTRTRLSGVGGMS